MGSEVPGNVALVKWPLSNVFLSSLPKYVSMENTCSGSMPLSDKAFVKVL